MHMGCVQSTHDRSLASDDNHRKTLDNPSSEIEASQPTASTVALPYEKREEVHTLARDQYVIIASTESITGGTTSNESLHTQKLATRHFGHAPHASGSIVSSSVATSHAQQPETADPQSSIYNHHRKTSSKQSYASPTTPSVGPIEHGDHMDGDDDDDGYAYQSIVLVSQQNSPTVKSSLQITHAHTSNDLQLLSSTGAATATSSTSELTAPVPPVLKTQRSAPLIAFKTYKIRTPPKPSATATAAAASRSRPSRHLQTGSDHNISIKVLRTPTIPPRSKSHDPATAELHLQLEQDHGQAEQLQTKPKQTDSLRVLSKYAYNTSKNGKINTTKHKQRFVHAKSRSIPQNLFSSTLNEYQTAENNTYQYLSQITHFDQNALRLLHLRFDHVDTLYTYNGLTAKHATNDNDDNNENDNDNGEIQMPRGKWSVEHMAFIFGLSPQCVLVKRFFAMMDQHGMKEISFRVFAITMSILSDKASFEEKCKFSFALYDVNRDDAIDADELRVLVDDLLTSARDTFDPTLWTLLKNERFLNNLMDQTMREFELDAHRRITYAAYCKYAQRNPRVLLPYTLDVEKLLDFEAEQRRLNRISMNSLAKKQLRQMVIGQDPKKLYNKKWHKPQWYKHIARDEVQRVDSIHDANDICKDLDIFDDQDQEELNSSLREITEASYSSDIEQEAKMQQKIQDTIDFLYD